MPPRNNIVMIKRENPKRVALPDGRVFYAKYKRADKDVLPPNIQIMRRYKQRAAPKGKRRRRRVGQKGRGFKSFFKKAANFGKKAFKNKTVRGITRQILQNAPDAFDVLSRKVNNKKIKKILNSDIARTGVDLATGFALDKLSGAITVYQTKK